MFKNLIKITFRNVTKNKIYAIINVTGLALGIVGGLAIFLIIRFETSFDSYHEGVDQIYRLVRTEREFGETNHTPGIWNPLPAALRQDFPEIEALTIVDSNFSPSVFGVERADGSVDRYREEKGVTFVNPDYFEIFSYKWLLGDRRSALAEPNSVVLSQGLAQKYFGDENPLGRMLTLDNKLVYQVTGVVADVPQNTDLPFNMLLAYNPAERGSDNWSSVASAVQCYVKLSPQTDPQELESRFDAFLSKYLEQEKAEKITMALQPLRDMHFDSRFGTFGGRTVTKQTLFALGLIGLLLLITACINFVNLNTALAVNRSKEVGVRKVLGGNRTQLMLQFLGETAIITLVAILLSLALAESAFGQLQEIIGYRLSLDLFQDMATPFFLIALLVVVTLCAGFYPAMHLSNFLPSQAIRNKITINYSEGFSLRRGLVVLQFAISQVLIICTIVIGSQLRYFQKADMGFNKDALVELEIPDNETVKLQRFKNLLLRSPAIERVGFSNTGTASSNTWGGNYTFFDGEFQREGHAQVKFVDQDFIQTYQLQFLAGEGFAAGDTLDRFVVNQTFADEVGYGRNLQGLLGKQAKIWGREASVAGIVKDFNTMSLHHEILPVIMMVQNRYWLAGVKCDQHNLKTALSTIEAAWSEVYPGFVFHYTFLDDNIRRFYEDEQRTARLINTFTAIAIIIGGLGLFGLVSYMATRRTKEIGIRKVLGAGISDILTLFLKEFTLLIVVAFALAAPLAYFFMDSWLADFAYRVNLNPGMFLLGLLASIVISFLTVGSKSIRSARANPVEALRYE